MNARSHSHPPKNGRPYSESRHWLRAITGLAGFTMLIAASIVIVFAALTFLGVLLLQAIIG